VEYIMIDLRRASRPLGLMAALALSAALTACVASTPVTAPDGTAVAPAGQGGESTPAPTGPSTATPTPAATNAPDGTPSATPTATTAPAAGGSGGSGGGSSGGSSGPIAKFDVDGSKLRIRVTHTGEEAFVDLLTVQVGGLPAALPGAAGNFRVAGGSIDLGSTYVFAFDANPPAATAGSLAMAPLTLFGADGTAGIAAEGRLLVTALNNAVFGSSRIYTGSADSWQTAPNVYFATRYNAQPSFSQDTSKAALRRGQTSNLDFELPGTMTGQNITVKVHASKASGDLTTSQPLTATFDETVIADPS
jgi:hypothetical protein